MEKFQSSEIYEMIDKVLHYQLFSVNQTPITISSLIVFVLTIALLALASRMISRHIVGRAMRRFGIEDTKAYTIRRVAYYLLLIISFIFAFQFIGIDLGGLAVIFGLLSVGIGFGLQNITANFIAGIILLFERPISIGDRVQVGETLGVVQAINMRSTTIRSLQNISIIVPNSEFISSQVVNWSHSDPKVRLDLPVGVSYESDLDKVLRVLKDVAVQNPHVMANPEPRVLHRGFGDSAWNMELRVWVERPELQFSVQSELFCDVVRAFRQNDIEIPFPQRDLHVRSAVPVPLAKGA